MTQRMQNWALNKGFCPVPEAIPSQNLTLPTFCLATIPTLLLGFWVVKKSQDYQTALAAEKAKFEQQLVKQSEDYQEAIAAEKAKFQDQLLKQSREYQQAMRAGKIKVQNQLIKEYDYERDQYVDGSIDGIERRIESIEICCGLTVLDLKDLDIVDRINSALQRSRHTDDGSVQGETSSVNIRANTTSIKEHVGICYLEGVLNGHADPGIELPGFESSKIAPFYFESFDHLVKSEEDLQAWYDTFRPLLAEWSMEFILAFRDEDDTFRRHIYVCERKGIEYEFYELRASLGLDKTIRAWANQFGKKDCPAGFLANVLVWKWGQIVERRGEMPSDTATMEEIARFLVRELNTTLMERGGSAGSGDSGIPDGLVDVEDGVEDEKLIAMVEGTAKYVEGVVKDRMKETCVSVPEPLSSAHLPTEIGKMTLDIAQSRLELAHSRLRSLR